MGTSKFSQGARDFQFGLTAALLLHVLWLSHVPSYEMVEEKPIENLFTLPNDALQVECPIFDAPLDSENYGDLLSPFGTPPNQYLSVASLPSVGEQNLGKQEDSDALNFPDGSPMTLQLQESPTNLSEINFESQEPTASPEPRKDYAQHSPKRLSQEHSFAAAKIQTNSNEEHSLQFRPSTETDLQELLELGKAMNLPCTAEDGISPAYPEEYGNTQARSSEHLDNDSFLPFPLEELLTPQVKDEIAFHAQHYANQSTLTPTAMQPCPPSSARVVTLQQEIGSGPQLPNREQQYNPEAYDIDDVLHVVASRNTRDCKRAVKRKLIASGETSTGAVAKKRKTSSSNEKDDKETDANNPSPSSEGTGQRRKHSKKGQGNGRKASELSGKAQISPGCTPSRFCHICTRAAKPDVVLVCGNVARGTCRKVICFKCIRDMSWDWGSLQGGEAWTCTHCRKDCPSKAQCHTYRRVNQNRRADGRRSRKTIDSTTEIVESNDQRNQ